MRNKIVIVLATFSKTITKQFTVLTSQTVFLCTFCWCLIIPPFPLSPSPFGTHKKTMIDLSIFSKTIMYWLIWNNHALSFTHSTVKFLLWGEKCQRNTKRAAMTNKNKNTKLRGSTYCIMWKRWHSKSIVRVVLKYEHAKHVHKIMIHSHGSWVVGPALHFCPQMQQLVVLCLIDSSTRDGSLSREPNKKNWERKQADFGSPDRRANPLLRVCIAGSWFVENST